MIYTSLFYEAEIYTKNINVRVLHQIGDDPTMYL